MTWKKFLVEKRISDELLSSIVTEINIICRKYAFQLQSDFKNVGKMKYWNLGKWKETRAERVPAGQQRLPVPNETLLKESINNLSRI